MISAFHREFAIFTIYEPSSASKPKCQTPTLDPQLSHQQLQVQDAGRMVNHHTPFRVANLFNLGWLADEGYKKKILI